MIPREIGRHLPAEHSLIRKQWIGHPSASLRGLRSSFQGFSNQVTDGNLSLFCPSLCLSLELRRKHNSHTLHGLESTTTTLLQQEEPAARASEELVQN